MFRVFHFFKSIIYTLLYKVFYRKQLKNNPFRSPINGTLVISNRSAVVIIMDGLRSRGQLSLNVNSGILSIGKKVFFNHNVSLNCQEKITIGDYCLFGNNVSVFDHNHIFNQPKKIIRNQGFKTASVTIGNNVWIGSGVIILKGVKIGDNAVIGAGVIVKNDIEKNSIVTNLTETNVRPISFK